MLEILRSIGEFFASIGEFFTNIIQAVFSLFSLLTQFPATVTGIVGFLPPLLVVAVSLFVALVIINVIKELL